MTRHKQGGDHNPYISVFFSCCKVYQRIYLNKDQDKFVGWCPKCTGKAVVEVNPDADPVQFFEAE